MDELGSDRLKVLVVRVGAMGDILHALPSVTALRESFPGCFIGWAIEPRWAALLEGPDGVKPVVDRLHRVDTRAWKQRGLSWKTVQEILALRQELRAERYDVCVDLQGSIRSAVIGRMAGARRFVGMEAPREKQARLLYQTRVAMQEPHVIEQGCELLGAAVETPLEPAMVKLAAGEAIAVGNGFCFLVPTAGWGAKAWPVAKYRELAKELLPRGFRVVVNATSEDDRVAREIGAEICVCSVAELLEVTRRAAVVVGGDTGPVHMAAALGTPVVALFGPTDPARTGPQRFVGSQVQVLRDSRSSANHRRIQETEVGLGKIEVEAVLQAIAAVIEKSKQ